MSFGSSVGDCILLVQLAWNTYQGAKKACGEHDELTREISSLYKVLNRLQKEISNPESLVHKASDDKRQELEEHAAGCEGILRTMDNVLTKFNTLTGEQRRGKKLWQKIKFANGQMKDLADIRIKLSAHTSAIMMSLNLCSLDSLGRVEATLGRVEARSTSHSEQLRGIRKALHWVTANMAATTVDGSVWTSYTNDDQRFWRGLRRELVKEGYRSSTLQKHKGLIQDYVEELGNRGVFDEIHDSYDDEVPISQTLSTNSGCNENDYGSLNFEKPVYEFVENDQVRGAQVRLDSQASGVGDELVLDGVTVGQSGSMPNELRDSAAIVRPASVVSGDHNRPGAHNHALDRLHTATGQDDNELSDSSSIHSDDGQLSPMTKDSSENLELEVCDFEDPFASTDAKPSMDTAKSMLMFEKSTDNNDGSTNVTDPPPSGIRQSSTTSEKAMCNEIFSPIQGCLDSADSGTSRDNEIVKFREVQSKATLQSNIKASSPFSVQIEEVLDEEYGGAPFHDRMFRELVGQSSADHDIKAIPDVLGQRDGLADGSVFVGHSSVVFHQEGMLDRSEESDDAQNDGAGFPKPYSPPTVSVEEVVDEEFLADAHPNVSTVGTAIFDDGLDPELLEAADASSRFQDSSPKEEKLKQVRFADEELVTADQEFTAAKQDPEDLRFIFYYEFRDFEEYQELQESYQALFDENEVECQPQESQSHQPESASTFITHSPYTPPATMFDLQYYHIPASYFHTFWHPQRNPIYLHGNVFDGISLTNWIYNWTAYTFKDDSYQMNTVQRFGRTVTKLGSALSDIEHAQLLIKKNIPRDISDEGFALWANLEDTINDIMSLAEDRLATSKRGGRLEIEFVRRFCHEMIAGGQFYRAIDTFLKQTEAWCKKARLHPEMALAWELFLEV